MRTRPAHAALCGALFLGLVLLSTTRGAWAEDVPADVRIGARIPMQLRQGCTNRSCVCPSLAASVRAASDAARDRFGLRSHRAPALLAAANDDAPWLYRFYPAAGNLGADTFNVYFVDVDPASPGAFDYACRHDVYDGHGGIDTEIRSFGEQLIGVPVFAARDGVVVFTQDGWPDMNLEGGEQGNIVVIDHGDGYESQYYHLKKDSVSVSVGEAVVAGTQIGMIGSSGNSFGPHLHFETAFFDGSAWSVIEPFAGDCRPGPSLWLDQAPLDDEGVLLHDFGMTRTWLDDAPQPWWEPWPLPTDGQVYVDDDHVIFWWRVLNFPADAPIRVRFYRPDESLAWDAQWNWGNDEAWRTFKSWSAFPLPAMGPIVGTWRLRFEIGGVELMDTPFEVTAELDPAFNRPPNPVGAAFDPPDPNADDVLFCRVLTTPGKEDPDWDIVRYRYVWRVGDRVVRDVVTAAQSDAIPRGTAVRGERLTCTVTPSDGLLEGEGATASIRFGGLFGDLDGTGAVNGADLGLLLGSWGACPGCAADLDGDGTVGGADLGLLLGSWTG